MAKSSYKFDAFAQQNDFFYDGYNTSEPTAPPMHEAVLPTAPMVSHTTFSEWPGANPVEMASLSGASMESKISY